MNVDTTPSDLQQATKVNAHELLELVELQSLLELQSLRSHEHVVSRSAEKR